MQLWTSALGHLPRLQCTKHIRKRWHAVISQRDTQVSQAALCTAAACHAGQHQSPINLDTREETHVVVSEDYLPNLDFGTGKNVKVYNTGHAVQVQWEALRPSQATVTLGALFGQPNATGDLWVNDTLIGQADDRCATQAYCLAMACRAKHVGQCEVAARSNGGWQIICVGCGCKVAAVLLGDNCRQAQT